LTPGGGSAAQLLAERRRQRAELIELARRFAVALPTCLGIEAVVVFGSVARGDFNVWSDLDVLVVARGLPADWFERHRLLMREAVAPISVVGWTPPEWAAKLATGDAMAMEAAGAGVVVAGRLP
jgi:hypothetical protein